MPRFGAIAKIHDGFKDGMLEIYPGLYLQCSVDTEREPGYLGSPRTTEERESVANISTINIFILPILMKIATCNFQCSTMCIETVFAASSGVPGKPGASFSSLFVDLAQARRDSLANSRFPRTTQMYHTNWDAL
jgi:hypothetical protein